MKNAKRQVEELAQVLDKLAETYATDANGQFDLQCYLAYRAGLDAGLSAAVQVLRGEEPISN